MRNQRGFTVTELLALIPALIIVIGIGGWVANIVKVFGSDFANFTALLAVRCIGIALAPLGAVMGFI